MSDFDYTKTIDGGAKVEGSGKFGSDWDKEVRETKLFLGMFAEKVTHEDGVDYFHVPTSKVDRCKARLLELTNVALYILDGRILEDGSTVDGFHMQSHGNTSSVMLQLKEIK